jgi:hypothetical protein
VYSEIWLEAQTGFLCVSCVPSCWSHLVAACATSRTDAKGRKKLWRWLDFTVNSGSLRLLSACGRLDEPIQQMRHSHLVAKQGPFRSVRNFASGLLLMGFCRSNRLCSMAHRSSNQFLLGRQNCAYKTNLFTTKTTLAFLP